MRKNIFDYKKQRITWEELLTYFELEDYQELVNVVHQLISEGKLRGNQSSGSNGRKPALYKSYTILRPTEENEEYTQELLYLSSRLDNQYYLRNQKKYRKDRSYVLAVNEYMNHHMEYLKQEESYNERSYEIFHREKYLLKEGGLSLLKHLGIDPKELNVYETSEPIAYYSKHKEVPQTIVIIENKDTFYSMRKYLIEGNDCIFGKKIGSLIYGSGKGVGRSLKDFRIGVEPYMLDPENEYLYFGDLDYEGIGIYEGLYEIMKEEREVLPFKEAYIRMIEKSEGVCLPKTKEKQNHHLKGIFQQFFQEEEWEKMHKILCQERYIPQESLVSRDFSSKRCR